ncbi:MAG: response regulator [Candidatus Devosia phytovorans]|uniref:Response regulator n=1 Tax=Candidatus Devosia phytovorans TaxID=3121372 RepID=A0AAJ5VV49_9HYPH|nr:response regulator [Devosia sp.]WEK04705.1 MAG: response regulator [Devosia sp.]
MLVVDDQVLVRTGIVQHLDHLGYDVYEAGDTEEAIEIIESIDDIRLVFTDVDMPGSVSGLTLARAVAHLWAPIRIIVTSGKIQVDGRDLPAGVRYCAKPYSYRSIAQAIETMLA